MIMDEYFLHKLKKHSYIIVIYLTYLLYLVADSEELNNIFILFQNREVQETSSTI